MNEVHILNNAIVRTLQKIMENDRILSGAVVGTLQKIMGNAHNLNCSIVRILQKIMGNAHYLNRAIPGPYRKQYPKMCNRQELKENWSCIHNFVL
jgi:hypothetical protein